MRKRRQYDEILFWQFFPVNLYASLIVSFVTSGCLHLSQLQNNVLFITS